MNKFWIIFTVFLVFGGLIIYQQTSEPKTFATQYSNWVFHVGGNVKDVTTHAVKDYTWLPPGNSTTPPVQPSSQPLRKK